MLIKSLSQNISKDSILLYLTISIGILFFFTSIVKIELGHLVALIITIIFLLYLTITKNENVQDFNTELEFKLNSLLDNEDPPEYFYIDADIINLFFNIKQDFAEYNYDAYKNAILCANTLLSIRFDMERNLCSPPLVPDLKRNFKPTNQIQKSKGIGELNEEKEKSDFLNVDKYDFIDDKKCNSTLLNAFENYQIAEENVKKCMNFLHSFIIIIPNVPVMHRKHEKILERVYVLLKRNLDIIKKRYDNSIKNKMSHTTKLIEDYDLPKAFNKHNENNIMGTKIGNFALSNFNFY